MSAYDDTRYYDEYDDDRQHDHARDYDDYDEADLALSKQVDLDQQVAWKVQVHELAHAMRDAPLPGTSFAEELRNRFNVTFPPLPDFSRGGAGLLRNLYDDNAYKSAKESACSSNSDIAWFGAKFLYWRTEALGRYCYNVQCLKLLSAEGPRRGRPRFYCKPEYEYDEAIDKNVFRSCKEAAKKRRAYHEAHPNAGQRLKPMLVPGIPFSSREDRRGDPTRWGWRPAFKPDRFPPSLSGQCEDERPVTLVGHFDRWLSKHIKKKSYAASRDWGKATRTRTKRRIEAALGGPSLEELVLTLLNDGYVFSGREQDAIEDLIGQSLESLVNGEQPVDEDDGAGAVGPLPQRAISELSPRSA